jgi:signal transduction histidine kinase
MMKISFPDKLINQAKWLIKIRWYVFFCTILLIGLGHFFSIANLDFKYLYISALFLIPFNLLYFIDIIRISRKEDEDTDKHVVININLQIVFDYIILAALLHFSGGIENPFIIFFIFHMIIGSIILPKQNAYLLAGLAATLLIAITFTEYCGLLHHYSINIYISEMIVNDPIYLFGSLAIFVFTAFSVVFFAVTLNGKLKKTKMLLNQSNQSLLEKDKIKNEFIQRVTHDIKGSLATISSCLSVVDKQILEPVSPQNADFVNKALTRTNKLKLFLNDLLLLTKMRLDNRFETLDIKIYNIVTNVIQRATPEAEQKNIKLSFKALNKSLIISGIEVSIEEAIYNIVQNAVKYTPDGGKVNVVLKKLSEGKVLIEVSDNGIGISHESLPHIFDEFYRGDNITKIDGTGLGLSLVKAIVDRHKGDIKVTSTLGVGSTFSLFFDIK